VEGALHLPDFKQSHRRIVKQWSFSHLHGFLGSLGALEGGGGGSEIQQRRERSYIAIHEQLWTNSRIGVGSRVQRTRSPYAHDR
jgi:hypothetical protein